MKLNFQKKKNSMLNDKIEKNNKKMTRVNPC
jgi:hypothetical protein